ncbi:MAG: HU family DNA-binding protein [Solirubrobacterales bacterium]
MVAVELLSSVRSTGSTRRLHPYFRGQRRATVTARLAPPARHRLAEAGSFGARVRIVTEIPVGLSRESERQLITTKDELAKQVAARTGLETGQAKLAVEATIEEITAQLAAGNEVKFTPASAGQG